MDHRVAVRKLAAQRYLLGELTGQEKDQFESHFFTCPECAQEVRDSAEFVDNLRAVLKEGGAPSEQPAKWWRQSWFGWLRQPAFAPAMAAAGFAMVAGYQQFIRIPAIRASLTPRAAVMQPVRPSDVRGDLPVVTIDRGAAFGTLPLLVDPGLGSKQIQFEIRNASNTAVDFATVPVNDSTSGVQVQIPLPAEKFTGGRYQALARERRSEDGPWSEVVARYEFEVQHK